MSEDSSKIIGTNYPGIRNEESLSNMKPNRKILPKLKTEEN